MKLKPRLKHLTVITLALSIVVGPSVMAETFVRFDRPDTTAPATWPGCWQTRPLSQASGPMKARPTPNWRCCRVLWVLHSRIHFIPKGYTQPQVAGVRSKDIIEVITGGGGRRQCEGFYKNAAGQFVTDRRVEERLENLLGIANSGGKPGRFAALLNYAQGLARAYVEAGIEGADCYAGLRRVGYVDVTGRAYSWMTDVDSYHPGGNFVSIPSADDGSLGGNRFFTLRKSPK